MPDCKDSKLSDSAYEQISWHDVVDHRGRSAGSLTDVAASMVLHGQAYSDVPDRHQENHPREKMVKSRVFLSQQWKLANDRSGLEYRFALFWSLCVASLYRCAQLVAGAVASLETCRHSSIFAA